MFRAVYDWVRGNRLLVVLSALALVALPTVFAVFPGLAVRLSRGWRELIMLGWLLVAAFTTIASQTRESESGSQAQAAQSIAQGSQRILLRQYLTLLLSSQQSHIPDCYRTSVYLSNDADLLLPWFPTQEVDPQHPTVFKYGQGATGTAFVQQEPIVAVGDAVSSDEYGLTPAQQQYFSEDVIVAAVPIRLLSGVVAGALTVISTLNDGSFSSPGPSCGTRACGFLRTWQTRLGTF